MNLYKRFFLLLNKPVLKIYIKKQQTFFFKKNIYLCLKLYKANFFQKNHICIFNKTKKYIKILHNLAYQQNKKKWFLCFTCIIDLITSLLKSQGRSLNFINTKNNLFIFNIKHYERRLNFINTKNNLFIFNIKHYEHILKIYS